MSNPLDGKHIVITRDAKQSKNLIDKVTELGGIVELFPTIKISEPENWSICDKVLKRIQNFDWIVFSSSNGVRYFLNRAEYLHITNLKPSIAAVGKKTAGELKKYGIAVDLIPTSYSAGGLLKEFKDFDIKNRSILIPTSNLGGNELVKGFKNLGAFVEKVDFYQTDKLEEKELKTLKNNLLNNKIDCITFYSPSAVHSFINIMGESTVKLFQEKDTVIAAIGPITAKEINSKGYKVHIQPEKSVDESMVEALVRYFNKSNWRCQ